MGCLNDTALATGGTVTGIIPRFMVERGWHHTGLTQLVETGTMHERKELMAQMSDAVIALPGGCGTMEELMEITLIEMLEKAIDQHFMRREHESLWEIAFTPDEAVNLCCTIPLWNKEIRKFAEV